MTLNTTYTFCLEKFKEKSDLDIMTEAYLVTRSQTVAESDLVSMESKENGDEIICTERLPISETGIGKSENYAPKLENDDKHNTNFINVERPVKGSQLLYPNIPKIEINEWTYQGLGEFVVEKVFHCNDTHKASFGNENFKGSTHDHMFCDSSYSSNFQNEMQKLEKDMHNQTIDKTNSIVTSDQKMHVNRPLSALSSKPNTNNDQSECSDDDVEVHRPRLRKASSLKEVTDFRGTKGCKKIVRFADALGLDLESVRHVFDTDKPPYIPSSARSNLKTTIEPQSPFKNLQLEAKFNLGSSPRDFIHSIILKKVCLTKVEINGLYVIGFVKVLNIAFQKNVRVRYTINNWISFSEIMTSYHSNQDGGQIDQFTFNISAPPSFYAGERLEFAISYTVAGNVYWDNNNGKNYVFECAAVEQNKKQQKFSIK